MTLNYLIINILEIYLITLTNSALCKAGSETVENSFIFLAGMLEMCLSRKMLESTLTGWHTLDLKSAPSR